MTWAVYDTDPRAASKGLDLFGCCIASEKDAMSVAARVFSTCPWVEEIALVERSPMHPAGSAPQRGERYSSILGMYVGGDVVREIIVRRESVAAVIGTAAEAVDE